MIRPTSLLLLLSLSLNSHRPVRAGESIARTPANVPAEIELAARRPHADPFNDVTLDVLFTDPAGATRRVPAFWAGGTKWKARYASPLSGTHHWRSECSDQTDLGLQGVEGRIDVKVYEGRNPLYRHGPMPEPI